MNMRAVTLVMLLAAPWLAGGGEVENVDIREWEVPWQNSRPRDPFVEPSGRVWFVGQRDHYVASLDPDSGEFKRFELEPGTGPHNLIVSGDGDNAVVWYAGNRNAHIGRLDPKTGAIDKFPMPVPQARDPHTLIFDNEGDIWFTVQGGNFVGRLATNSGEVSLIEVPTRGARPYGIKLNSKGEPWVVEVSSPLFRRSCLLS